MSNNQIRAILWGCKKKCDVSRPGCRSVVIGFRGWNKFREKQACFRFRICLWSRGCTNLVKVFLVRNYRESMNFSETDRSWKSVNRGWNIPWMENKSYNRRDDQRLGESGSHRFYIFLDSGGLTNLSNVSKWLGKHGELLKMSTKGADLPETEGHENEGSMAVVRAKAR